MNTSAPEFKRVDHHLSARPAKVISTWRFLQIPGVGATFQSPARTLAVSGRKSKVAPAASFR